MEPDETLGLGEMDDINLPLDEIIQRKSQQERGPDSGRYSRRAQPRRFGPPSRRPPPRVSRTELPPQQFGTGVFHGERVAEGNWQGYDERPNYPAPPMPPTELETGPYWQPPPPQIYPQPPPPPVRHEEGFSGGHPRQHYGGVTRGGVRKPVSDRRRGTPGRGRRPYRRPYHERQPESKPQPREEKCTMTFDKGQATIKFSGIEILKVSAKGDLVLTTEGHQEGRFFKALNDVLGLINIEILGEGDRPDSWKVKDGYALFRYYDGIAIRGKGGPTRSRAETIKKAFEQPNPKALEATLASNLAARRLGLSFDPISPTVTPGGSIRITQDQQLTRTSQYSISFVDQQPKESQDDTSHYPPY